MSIDGMGFKVLPSGPLCKVLQSDAACASLPAMFDILLELHIWISLATLTGLEIVLGIDNIVFISILASRLPESERRAAWRLGLALALITRILLLLMISSLTRLVAPLFTVASIGISGRDLVLLLGGLFLIAKSTHEIHHKVGHDSAMAVDAGNGAQRKSFWSVIAQIVLIDLVFSFDSVITAVGMVQEIGVMVAAIIISIGVMLVFAQTVSRFIETHPTLKMLALAFLLMIGTLLVAEGLHFHMPRGYIYFAMAFSLFVEVLNIRTGQRARGERTDE